MLLQDCHRGGKAQQIMFFDAVGIPALNLSRIQSIMKPVRTIQIWITTII